MSDSTPKGKSKQVRLPALKIPSDPPKFRFKRRALQLKPLPSSTDCPQIREGSNVGDSADESCGHVNVPKNEDKLPPYTNSKCHLPPLCGLPTCSGVVPEGYGGGAHLCGMVNTKCVPTHDGSLKSMKENSKHLAYGTNNWMQMLVSGQLPPHVLEAFMQRFGNVGMKAAQQEMNFRYSTPINRDKELWEPKMTPPPYGSVIEKSLLDAQYRHKERMDKVSSKCKAQAIKAETNIFRKADTQDSRINSYLNKLEKRTQEKLRASQKNKNNSKCDYSGISTKRNSRSHLQPVWEIMKKRIVRRLPPIEKKY